MKRAIKSLTVFIEMLEGDKLIEQERVNVTLGAGITKLSFVYE
jgi:hypothetical protein